MSDHVQVTMRGKSVTLSGVIPEVGSPAPDFSAVTTKMEDFRLSELLGHVVLVASVPSLDTPTCDVETRRFNQEAAGLDPEIRIVTVSMDLPFAQARWCGAAGVDRVVTVSDYRDRSFGDAWGLRIREVGLLARAVSVVDRGGVVRYLQVVQETVEQPDF
ncbi:MAG: thiol peroxidase, partial [bacterium]|nr:thiol peroxidase [bacterium]